VVIVDSRTSLFWSRTTRVRGVFRSVLRFRQEEDVRRIRRSFQGATADPSLTTPKLCPKEQTPLFGDPLKKALGAPCVQDDSAFLIDSSGMDLSRYLPQRTTILVPLGTLVPEAGACSRTVPLPLTCICRPAAAVISMAERMGRPTSEGTLNFLPSLMET
jgi:hypothetical protein